jgi:hypothetical protein
MKKSFFYLRAFFKAELAKYLTDGTAMEFIYLDYKYYVDTVGSEYGYSITASIESWEEAKELMIVKHDCVY